jgi:hypothetical protein
MTATTLIVAITVRSVSLNWMEKYLILEQGVLTLHAGSPASNVTVMDRPSAVYDVVGSRASVGFMSDNDDLGTFCQWPSHSDLSACFVLKVPLKSALFVELLDDAAERWQQTLGECVRIRLPSRKTGQAAPDYIPREGFSGKVASGRSIGNDTLYKCYAMFWDGKYFERVTSVLTRQEIESIGAEIKMDTLVAVEVPSFPQGNVSSAGNLVKPRQFMCVLAGILARRFHHAQRTCWALRPVS